MYQLNISEFAALCNSNRKTLIFYDSVGLLKPDGRTSQGYRYYKSTQVAQFQMIQLLKSFHFSVEEMINFFNNPNYHSDLPLLQEKLQLLLKQREELDLTISRLHNTISLIHDKNHCISETPTLQYRKEKAYYFFTPIFPSVNLKEDSFYTPLKKHIRNSETLKNVLPFPTCVCTDISFFPDNRLMCNGICYQLTDNVFTSPENIYCLDSGYYVVCKCNGSWTEIDSMMLSMYNFALSNGYTITGNFLNQGTVFDFDSETSSGNCFAFLPVVPSYV